MSGSRDQATPPRHPTDGGGVPLLLALVLGCTPPKETGVPQGDTSVPAMDTSGGTGETGVETGLPVEPPARRVPAEWEPQEAVWLQWPGPAELRLREDMARILAILPRFEPVHLLVEDGDDEALAREFLEGQGVDPSTLTWDWVPHDWAWLRDNGPVWVLEDEQARVQDWRFDAWGGPGPSAQDDAVPGAIAALTGAPLETYDLVVERGTLEFNGVDTLITSWPCLHDRNPGVTREEMESLFYAAFGVSRVIWLESYPSDDLTLGHVDGIARFIDADTVAVARYVDDADPDAAVYEEAAHILSLEGLEVLRMDVPGRIHFHGWPMAANYLNWLVLNGAVLTTGFQVPEWDGAARDTLASWFGGREILTTDTRELWYSGGGVHCVTNDAPASDL